MKSQTTTWTGVSAAITGTLTVLAALPYQLGDAATIIPPDWKQGIVIAGLVATTILRIWNSVAQADEKKVAILELEVSEAKEQGRM
jgi:hypothetical protein